MRTVGFVLLSIAITMIVCTVMFFCILQIKIPIIHLGISDTLVIIAILVAIVIGVATIKITVKVMYVIYSLQEKGQLKQEEYKAEIEGLSPWYGQHTRMILFSPPEKLSRHIGLKIKFTDDPMCKLFDSYMSKWADQIDEKTGWFSSVNDDRQGQGIKGRIKFVDLLYCMLLSRSELLFHTTSENAIKTQYSTMFKSIIESDLRSRRSEYFSLYENNPLFNTNSDGDNTIGEVNGTFFNDFIKRVKEDMGTILGYCNGGLSRNEGFPDLYGRNVSDSPDIDISNLMKKFEKDLKLSKTDIDALLSLRKKVIPTWYDKLLENYKK